VLLPLAFDPWAQNAFGAIKRDIFFMLGIMQLMLAGLRVAGRTGLRLDRMAASPVIWPLLAIMGTAVSALLGAAGAHGPAALDLVVAAGLAACLVAEEDPTLGMRILTGHTLAVTLAGLYGLVQFYGGDPFVWQRGFAAGAPGSTYGNPLFLADGLAAAVVCGTALASRPGGRGWLGWSVTTSVAVAALLTTQARGAWIGCAVAGVVWFVMVIRGGGAGSLRPMRLGVIAVSAMVAAILWSRPGPMNPRHVALAAHASTLLDPGRDEFRGRHLLWHATALLAREHPLAGWGPGQLRFEYTGVQARLLATPRYAGVPYHSTQHAHSDPLQILAERGVVGLGLVVWLLASVGAVALSGPGRPRGAQAIAALIALVWLVDGLFNGPWSLAPSMYLMWIVLTIAARQATIGHAAGRARLAPRRPAWGRLIAAAALCVLILRPALRDLVSEGYLQEGVFALEARWPRRALPSLLRAFALAGEDRRHRFFIGLAYLGLGEARTAEQEFLRDVEENPGLASGWHDLGVARWQQGDASGALAAFREALRLNPHAEETQHMLTEVAARRRRGALTREKTIDKID